MTKKKRFKPKARAPSFKPQRHDVRRLLWFAPLLLIAGALLDPSLIEPLGPLAATERVSATFTPCGPGRGSACVIDGDTFKLGDRKIRITGIDVVPFVEAELNRRFPGRADKRAGDPDGLRAAWAIAWR